MEDTIALVCDSAGYGGVEVYLATLVSHLRERWRFVALLGDGAPAQTRQELESAGAEVLTVPGMRRIPSGSAVLRLARMLRRVDPKLVHVNLTDQGDGLGPLLASRLSRRPTIGTLHLVIPGRDLWREHVSRRALLWPRLVVCVSEHVAEYARAAGARTRVVLNGLVEPVLDPTPRAALGLSRDELVVGGIGRLHEQKGWDVLCRAARLVHEESPEVRFVVVGDGPDADALRRTGGADVTFLGFRGNASSLVGAFDVLAVPSRYEAFGYVALEAMYAGVPVVASAVGGLPEVIGDCGVLVQPATPEELAAAILKVVRDPDARREGAQRARLRARTLFSAQRMAAETGRVYAEVAA